jgi:GNAT superfamily N-acetyltransferase
VDWKCGEFEISTDRERLDREAIHAFLSNSYWARGIPRAVLDRSIENSLCFGVYEGASQVGFARVITDYATFAYVGDVFVLEPFRGQGLSKWLMECMTGHPDLQGLRRWMLATRAHVSTKFGFRRLASPDRLMEIVDVDIYLKIPRSLRNMTAVRYRAARKRAADSTENETAPRRHSAWPRFSKDGSMNCPRLVEWFLHWTLADFWRVAIPEDRTVAEVDFLEKILESTRSRLFDVPCGQGRHSPVLARRGYRSLRTFHELRAARQSAAAEPAIEWIERDMRSSRRARPSTPCSAPALLRILDDRGNQASRRAPAPHRA